MTDSRLDAFLREVEARHSRPERGTIPASHAQTCNCSDAARLAAVVRAQAGAVEAARMLFGPGPLWAFATRQEAALKAIDEALAALDKAMEVLP